MSAARAPCQRNSYEILFFYYTYIYSSSAIAPIYRRLSIFQPSIHRVFEWKFTPLLENFRTSPERQAIIALSIIEYFSQI